MTPGNAEAVQSMWLELAETRDGTKVTLENVTRSGSTIQCEWYNTPLVDPGGRVVGFASLVQDVTERLNTERTIHYMAHHDALTGLPNRRLMQDRLSQAIMQARRKQRHVAVLFLDLDRFKLLNDTLGHDTGDYILKDVARRLTSCVREVDTVSREGGDEFVVVLPDLERPENARVVADKILRELGEAGGDRRPGDPHHDLDRDQPLPERRDRREPPAQARRQRDVPGEGLRPQHRALLHQRPRTTSCRGGSRSRGGCARASRTRSSSCATSRRSTSPPAASSGMEALMRWNDPVKGEVLPAATSSPSPRTWASSCRWASGRSAPPAGSCRPGSRRACAT